MEKKYRHLLSPLMVKGKLIKNRMGMSRAMPTVVTGCDDKYALETLEIFAGMMAKNGAAIVTCASPVWKSKYSKQMPPPPPPPEPGNEDSDGGPGPGGPNMGDPEAVGMYTMDGVDMDLPNNKHRYARTVAAIHSYGSLASISMMDIEPSGWSFSTIPESFLSGVINDFVEKAEIYYRIGFDIVTFYMSYRNSLMAQSLSPDLNRRTDCYGGTTVAERAKFTFEIFRKTQERCPGLLIEAQISGEDEPGGFTQNDLIEYIHLAEQDGLIDILQVRSKNGELAHPIGMNSKKGEHDTLRFAEMLKNSGTKLLVAPVGGYQDPDENERILADGKADMLYMARAFICDSHYGEKLYAGRNDYTPCIRCNKCHTKIDDSCAGCSVNPEMILELYRSPLYPPSTTKIPKKIAVIGGGPAGMEAALVADQCGHCVTLYEASPYLGGQLRHADLVGFKWPVKDFKDYLISALMASKVDLRLFEPATPEALSSECYDAILYAAGAIETLPSIPGVDRPNVYSPLSAYAHEPELGSKVVVVGGSETGMETAHFLALTGREVTLITRKHKIAPNAQPIHYMDIIENIWKSMKNLSFIKHATATELLETGVKYLDRTGTEHFIECDSIVACGGSRPVLEQALDFAEITTEFRIIGDCENVSDIRHAMISAYTAAASL